MQGLKYNRIYFRGRFTKNLALLLNADLFSRKCGTFESFLKSPTLLTRSL